MSLWKRTMDYLGLGPDDYYDEYDEGWGNNAPRSSREEQRPSNGGWEPEPDDEPAVRTVSGRPTFPSRDFDASAAQRRPAGARHEAREPRDRDDTGVTVRPTTPAPPAPPPALRAVPGGSMEPHTVRPRRFDQAQEVADAFKSGMPVIMNLEGTERDIARRLIDFASGICYALDGTMEKVATGVYLLKPTARPSRYDDE